MTTPRPTPSLALALLAGTLLTPALHAQQIVPPPPANPKAPQPPPVAAARAFLDEAVSATDAIARAKELADAGNFTEAVRVLQDTLESESDQLVKSPTDPELFRTVRDAVHASLLASPQLLEKYRAEQGPIAGDALRTSPDAVSKVLSTRFMTEAGLDAALRTAQEQMEAARFEASRLTLTRALQHPDCAADRAADATRLANQLRAYLPRPDMDALVTALAAKASIQPPPAPKPIPAPPAERTRGKGPFDSFAAPPWDQLSTQPLQSVALATLPEDRRPWVQNNPDAPWVFPTLADETLYICDDQSVSAFDAATLAQLWRTTPAKVLPLPVPPRGEFPTFGGSRLLEDVSSPAVARNTVIAITGLPINSERTGDGRIHALRASDGALLWSLNPRYADDALDTGVLRGPPVVDADTVIVGVRKNGTMRRVISLYLLGIDLSSGQVRWNRLIGSVGSQVWGRSQTRPDASVLHEGVVYRGDDMGVLAAVNAATGEPLWVRHAGSPRSLDPNQGMTMPEEVPAYEIQKPIIAGNSIFFVEPGDGGVIQVNRTTGELVARRKGEDLRSPSYLVLVNDRLACVARSEVTFISVADFATATPVEASTARFDRPVQFTGRAVAMDGTLCVPTASGVVVIDAEHPEQTRAHALPRSGNIVVPTGASTAGEPAIAHAVVADNAGVHTFLSWDKAKATLEARVTRDPTNPAPVLTYLQLALRQGKTDLAPALADKALALINRAPDTAQSEKSRANLFDLLHASITASRRALVPGSPMPAQTEFPLPPMKDAALLTTLAERLVQAAESPRQRALALFDRSFLRTFVQQHEAAVTDLQELLADPALAAIPGSELDIPGATDAGATASSIASANIAAVLLTTGPAPYRVFDDEAAAVLASLDPASTALLLSDTARRYSLSAVAPAIWSRAADAATREKRTALARECLARGVESAILSRRIGREARPDDTGALAAGLLTFATSPPDQEPALMLLTRLAAAAPEATVGGAPLASALAPLRQSIAARAGNPAIGSMIADRVQAIEDWRPATSLQARRPGEATSLVPMLARNADRAALFAPSMSDSRLAPLWQRECDVAPTFVRITTEATILYFPRSVDPTLESISNIDGSTLWKATADISIFEGVNSKQPDRVARLNTPLDGLVRADDLLFAVANDTLVLARRDALAVALSLKDGKPLWHATLPMDRVFDLDCAHGIVAVAGAKPNATVRESLDPVAAAIDIATGQPTWTAPPEALGDHARWVRALPDAGALVGTSDKVLRVSARGTVSWSNATRPMRNTGSAWLCGPTAFILDDAYDLRALNLASGDTPDNALDDMGRLRLPFEVRATRDHLAVSSELGLITFDSAGEITGVDAIDTPGALAPAILCDSMMATVQIFPREDNNAAIRSSAAEARILVFSFPDARLLAQRRISLMDDPESLHVADGKLLIDQGSFTTVVDLRP